MNMFSQKFYDDSERLFEKYPIKVNALLPLLLMAQEEKGYISDEVAKHIAHMCQVSFTHVQGVVTFYTMLSSEPRGDNHISICTNVTCWLKGAESLLAHVEKKLSVNAGESTKDNRFFLEEVECLGACDVAPVVLCNKKYYENVNSQNMDKLIEELSND